MAEFDVDAYLEEDEGTAFDPDAFLSESSEIDSGTSRDQIYTPDTLKTAVRGFADTATFGTMDEIQGGAAAGLRALGIDLPLSNKLSDIELRTPTLDSDVLSKKYEDTLRAYRESTARGEDVNPISATAGAFSGAFLPGGLAAGAIKGTARLGGRALGKRALQVGAGTKAAKSAIKSGRGLSKVGATSASGAAGGAAYGFGQGEGDLSSRLEGAEEGAIIGGAAGVALPMLGGATKTTLGGVAALGKTLLEQPLERAQKIFNRARKGETFSGKEALKRVNDDIRKFAEDFDTSYGEQINTESEIRKNAVESAKLEGKIVDLKDSLANLRKKFQDLPDATEQERADKTDLLNIIDKYEKGIDFTKEKLKEKSLMRSKALLDRVRNRQQLSAAKAARGESGGAVGPVTGSKTPEGLPTVGFQQGERRIEQIFPEEFSYTPIPKTELAPDDALGLVGRLEDLTALGDRPLRTEAGAKAALEGKREVVAQVGQAVPEFSRQTQKISDLLSGFREISEKQKGNLAPTTRQYLDKIKSIVSKAEDDPSLVSDFNAVINDGWKDTRTGRKMLPLKEINPELAKSISSNFKNLAEENDLATAINNSLNNTSSFMRLIGGIEAFGLKGAELAGTGVRKATQSAKFPVDLSKDLMKLTPQQYQILAREISRTGGKGAKALSEKINSIGQADKRRKQAILFTILQNPEYRKFFSEVED